MSIVVKYFTPIFFVCYFILVFILPSVRTYRQTGINPIRFGTSESAHDYVGMWFKMLLTAIPFTITVYWFGGDLYEYLLPAEFLNDPFVQGSGVVLCVLSLVWTTLAQMQMKDSWRIGIDKDHNTKLITAGLFSVSRNPIFLGLMVTLIGLFLLVPNALTFVYLVAGHLLIQVIIRLEEEFLARQHGDSYEHYKQKVKRMI